MRLRRVSAYCCCVLVSRRTIPGERAARSWRCLVLAVGDRSSWRENQVNHFSQEFAAALYERNTPAGKHCQNRLRSDQPESLNRDISLVCAPTAYSRGGSRNHSAARGEGG